MVVSFVVLAVASVPVAVGLGVAVVIAVTFFSPFPLIGIAQRMVTGVDSFVLISIPFFMLTGRLMNEGGITDRLFDFARALIGPIRGGLAHANVLASMIFAGMSGSAVADAGGSGMVEIKAMTDQGYRKEYAAAVTVSSSTIGPIIPPSIPMVIYGAMAEVSVGRLFLGGIVPGVLMGLALMVLIYFWSFREYMPKDDRYSLQRIWTTFRAAFLPLLTPVILMGGIVERHLHAHRGRRRGGDVRLRPQLLRLPHGAAQGHPGDHGPNPGDHRGRDLHHLDDLRLLLAADRGKDRPGPGGIRDLGDQ